MLDINDFLTDKGGNPDKIRESQRRRGAPVEAVDQVIALYDDWRTTKYAGDMKGREINAVQKEIGMKKRNKENADELVAQKAALDAEKKALEEATAEKDLALKRKLTTIGNYVHDSVPVDTNEDNNRIEETWVGENSERKPEKRENCLSHHEVLLRLDGYEPERGVKVVGHRGYFLKGYGFFLNQALINYAASFLQTKTIGTPDEEREKAKKERKEKERKEKEEKGETVEEEDTDERPEGVTNYIPLQTPQFMNKDMMAKTAQLEQFDEELYKVVDGDQEKYLIATSEQPISAFHADEWLTKNDLPIAYAGYSSCYRREAGSHGKDAWGIFRVHQFEKIEQFVLTEPTKSWEAFDQMIGYAKEFYQTLDIPYRVVSIVSGALNNAAAKKYDLEAWFPYQGEYKELVSCSNCTDYQSRNLEIRFGATAGKDVAKEYVHCLNSTLCATERALCCILENYQGKNEKGVEGVFVPEVLRPYLPGMPTFLPYTKDLPKNSTSTKKAKKDVVVKKA
ncbi:cytoplasmic serine-tRNA ligase Srs1 [Ascobolus immersus RN42]|uniref:serine--tRNA ligase n=1 Tax=Ascobolus immersus RN42 TaxID=1160509 RepID=A0A3N4HR10_ASCIM|nr:cytoplasmic serine-tRNA ligase Srs1 [Ascobolus immersus RN42]